MSTSKKMIKEIKEHVSIVDLASDYFDLTRKNGYFGIRGSGADGGDFSSIVIYPESNSFFRNSNRHGGDVISFVTETQIEGINNFRDAVIFLRQRIDPDFKIETSYKKKKTYAEMSSSERIEKLRSCNEMLKENFSEEVEKTYKHAMAYLIQERKLDPEIVKEGFKNGEIAQVNMKGHKGVAFISKEMGLYSCISKRGISKGSKFKGDYKGCDYDYGWMKMIGATDGFIRFPFIVESVILSQVAALVAFGLKWLAYNYIVSIGLSSIELIEMVDFSTVRYYFLAGFMGIAFIFGVLGSVISIRKFLKV